MSGKSIHEALAEMQRKINEQRMKNAESNWNSIEEKTNAEIQQGVNDTVKQNNIKNPNLIFPGQKIKLPNGTDYTVQKGDNLWNINNMKNNPGVSSGTRPSEVPDSASQNKPDAGYQDKLPAAPPAPTNSVRPAPTINRYNGPIRNDDFRNRGVGATDATGFTNIIGPRGQGMDTSSTSEPEPKPATSASKNYPQPDVKAASLTMKQFPTGPAPPSAAGADEDGGPTKKVVKKKMSESTLINAFLGLDLNSSNIFEAAKKAKKDWDHDGKIESEKDEIFGSRFRAARKAGKLEEEETNPPFDPDKKPVKHTREGGHSEAKHLARAAMQKQKKMVKEADEDPIGDMIKKLPKDEKKPVPTPPVNPTPVPKKVPEKKNPDPFSYTGMKTIESFEEAIVALKSGKLTLEEIEAIEEKLIGKQTKLDKNHNGRLDKQDFQMLSGKKKMMEGKCPECGMNPCKCGPHMKEEVELDEAGPFANKVLASAKKAYNNSRMGQPPIDNWEKNTPAKRTAEIEKRLTSLKKVKIPGVQMENLFSDEELEHLASFEESAVAPQTDKNSADVGQVPSSAILDESGKKKMGRPSNAEKNADNPNVGMGRDPRQHIQVQAGRAMAGVPIDFKHDNGDVSKLTAPMGRKIVAHLADLKPADRQMAVAKMHASAEGLKV